MSIPPMADRKQFLGEIKADPELKKFSKNPATPR
jgi:hypothetical protein